MTHWHDVAVTNDGVAMLNEMMAGHHLRLTSAYGGTGVVDAAMLGAQTGMVNQKQKLALIDEQDGPNGKTVTVQISSTGNSAEYLLRQIGVYAKLDMDGAEEKLLFLMQDEGVTVPAGTEESFLLELYCTLRIGKDAKLTVNIDPSGIVTLQRLQATMDQYRTLTGEGAPAATTAGTVGQHYMDTVARKEYVCVAAGDEEYVWEVAGANMVMTPGGATCDMPDSLGDGPYLIELTDDDPSEVSEVSAGQVSYNGAQSGLQATTVQGAIDALDSEVDQLGAEMELVSNENILRNWYFADPVNQKRQTEYTGPGYTIDGWLLRDVGASVIIVDGGIKVSPQWFVQDFEADRIGPGKYTLSCLCFGGGISNMTVGIYTDTGIIDVPVTIKSTGPLAYGTFSVPESSIRRKMGISLVSDLTGNTIFKAAKLELGSKSTLAHKVGDTWVMNDPPPDKALELAKCQRYQFGLEGVYSAYGNAQTQLFVSIPNHDLRCIPSISGISIGWYRTNGQQFNCENPSVVSVSLAKNTIDLILNIPDGNFTLGQPTQIFLVNGFADSNL